MDRCAPLGETASNRKRIYFAVELPDWSHKVPRYNFTAVSVTCCC